MTQQLLRMHGYEAHLADSDEKSLHKLSSISFAVVLLDLNCGAQGGVKLIQNLRQTGLFVPPLIIVSGDTPERMKAAAEATAAHSILEKPFSGDQLREAVERARRSIEKL